IEGSGKQAALKHALLAAYFTDAVDVSAHAELVRIVGAVGLDAGRAAKILESDEFAQEVYEREQHYTGNGINSVPAVIINNRHLISGGQPVEIFADALRRIADQG